MATLFNTFAPPGFTRTGSGHLAMIRKGWASPPIIVRVIGSTATAAAVTLTAAGPVNVMTVTAKYSGFGGNSITATVANADDGNINHFNLTVTITSASGTTSDVVRNINVSGTGADNIPSVSSALLIGSLTKVVAGRPTNGTFSLTGGTDGTIAATDYVGTQGANDKGFAKLEGDRTIRRCFVGDPGNTSRPAVNAGGLAHANYMGDRIYFGNGNSGQTASAAQTDAATYVGDRMVYVDPWANIYDDTTGALTLVPGASFAASVHSQVSPSTSIAWKSSEVQQMLSGIVSLEFDRGQNAGNNTAAGICTIVKYNSGISFEAGVTTENISDATKKNITRRAMGDYIAAALTTSLAGMVDAPNVATNQDIIIRAVDQFLGVLKNNAKSDPNHTPFIVDYAIGNIAAANPAANIAAGQFVVPVQIQLGSAMEQIFISAQFGESITITVQ